MKTAAIAAMTVPRAVLPLPGRVRLVKVLGRRPWVPFRDRLAIELVRDFAERDPIACHRFLWSNHLAYAESYTVAGRFGADRINGTRLLLFDDLRDVLTESGVDPERDVSSVFEVGCSLGYLLQYLEVGMFSAATVLEGVDIDRQAIEDGSRHLRSIDSKVHLEVADVRDLEAVFAGRRFDVVLCAGVLLYLPESDARRLVATVLAHTRVIAAFAGVADPTRDNRGLPTSRVRERDATFIHDIDAMVDAAGGRVIRRRWEGARLIQDTSIYFVFASPGQTG